MATALAAALLTGPASGVAALPSTACPGLPPVVEHQAGQVVVPSTGQAVPTLCGASTGYPAVENRIEITNSGTVLYEPALQGGPVLSGDGHVPGVGTQFGAALTTDGTHWRPISVPVSVDDKVLDGQVDNNLYVDHVSGRLFWYMYNGAPGSPQVPYDCGATRGAVISYTANDGASWSNGSDLDHDCAENPTMISGRSSVPGEKLDGYPDVVYLCGDNISTGVATLLTLGYSCSKTLDGGRTWRGTTLDHITGQGFYAGRYKDQFDPYPQCGGQDSSGSPTVQPLPDGTLVTIVSCNGVTFLSASNDEGAHWKLSHPIPHDGQLRADSAGNLFVLDAPSSLALAGGGAASNQLLLSHSTDRGAHWSPEVNIVAPHVKSVGTSMFVQGTFASGHVGEMAVAYYGIRDDKSVDAQNGYSDGFITATRDALAANPVFSSGQVNPDGHPLLYNTRESGNIGLTVLDFNGGAWSPDGRTVWGSWVQDCGPNLATSPSCTSRYPQTNPGNPDDGYAAHLTFAAQGAAAVPQHKPPKAEPKPRTTRPTVTGPRGSLAATGLGAVPWLALAAAVIGLALASRRRRA